MIVSSFLWQLRKYKIFQGFPSQTQVSSNLINLSVILPQVFQVSIVFTNNSTWLLFGMQLINVLFQIISKLIDFSTTAGCVNLQYFSLTWGTIYGQVFSVSFRVSRLQGLQPSGELGTNCTVREIVETLKWNLFRSRLDIIFSIHRAILEWSCFKT